MMSTRKSDAGALILWGALADQRTEGRLQPLDQDPAARDTHQDTPCRVLQGRSTVRTR